MNYAIVGHGRMGRAIQVEAAAREHRLVAVVDPSQGTATLDQLPQAGAQVAFEFTIGAAAERNVVTLLRSGLCVVCGTTGWDPSPAVAEAARTGGTGAVIAPNFSVGVNVFCRVVDHAARMFGALGQYDPFVYEAHHRGKQDAPSGTARRLASILLAADPRLTGVIEGQPAGALAAGTLHVSSTRAGAEPGRHTVGFDGPHDGVTLEHRARGREGFALGAVLAGEWLLTQPHGVHSFDEVLDPILRDAGPGAGGPA